MKDVKNVNRSFSLVILLSFTELFLFFLDFYRDIYLLESMASFAFTPRKLLFLFFAIGAMVALTSAERGKKATLCTSNRCRLPDCFCAGARVPKGLKSDTIPQFVMISFDGSVRDLNYKRVQKIFADRRNPNGCPIRGECT